MDNDFFVPTLPSEIWKLIQLGSDRCDRVSLVRTCRLMHNNDPGDLWPRSWNDYLTPHHCFTWRDKFLKRHPSWAAHVLTELIRLGIDKLSTKGGLERPPTITSSAGSRFIIRWISNHGKWKRGKDSGFRVIISLIIYPRKETIHEYIYSDSYPYQLTNKMPKVPRGTNTTNTRSICYEIRISSCPRGSKRSKSSYRGQYWSLDELLAENDNLKYRVNDDDSDAD